MTTAIWDLDPVHSTLSFRVRHLMVSKVQGRFRIWSGSILIDDEDVQESHVAMSIDAASVDTGDASRDAHLRSSEFLDVEHYPVITFVSEDVSMLGGALAVTGTLTICGISKLTLLVVERGAEIVDPWGRIRTGFSATGTIDRRDFGLIWNVPLSGGGMLVGDRVDVAIEVEAIKAAAALPSQADSRRSAST